ncbi:hypothetical protein KIW84_045002 [Lathyrus oleraceus]|uniref:Small nuclear ribonucleoprotein E n=1 Tax=Pisum sativum TaxID=3888 RepID=A0A9D5AR50_PEA|nr:hypothetical protein KIW84_045002 [Pisum sativum]
MGAGKNTAELFRRRDEWRKHPIHVNQFRQATPGLGIALVAFGVYLVAEQVYNKTNASSSSHHKARIQIWHFEQKDLRIEGRISGFDEYMNLVLDDAEEVNVKKKSRNTLVCRFFISGAGRDLSQEYWPWL